MNTLPPQLLRLRRLATALLLAMGGLFITARLLESLHPVWAVVRAFAEAALVGGLADWFAVTALFRQPMGLPIPHTAIIPASKDRLADGVAEFLQQNFLVRRVLAEQFASLDFAAMISAALRDDVRRAAIVHQLAALAIVQLRIGPALGSWLQGELARQRHQAWFDQAIVQLQLLLEQQHADIYQKVCEKSPRWMPRRINDELYQRLIDGLGEMLADMSLPNSGARLQFEYLLRGRAERLIAGVYDAAFSRALQQGEGGRPGLLATQFDMALMELVHRLDSDAELRTVMNRWLRRRVIVLLVRQRTAIVGLVRRVIDGWDTHTVAARVESRVGRDLQFIRINGTLVGGLVGLLIHAISISL